MHTSHVISQPSPTVLEGTRQLGPSLARGVLLVLLSLVAWGLIAGSQIPQVRDLPVEPKRYSNDFDLYSAIADRVAGGESYYSAAVSEQVEAGYPVKPTATVRLPALVQINAALGEGNTYAMLLLLVAVVAVVALVRFEALARSRLEWIGLLLILAASLLQVASPASVLFAESWVLLLTLTALLIGVDRRPRTALLLTAAALLLREHALVFVGAMSLWLWLRGRRKLASAWIALAVVFLMAYLTIHAPLVAAAVADVNPRTQLRTSQGWLEFGGWPRVVDYVRASTPLSALPFAVSAVIVPLALLGWTMRNHSMAETFWMTIGGYTVAFSLVGRSNNLYWGLLYAALVLPGLALSWSALRACFASAFGRSRAAVTPPRLPQ